MFEVLPVTVDFEFCSFRETRKGSFVKGKDKKRKKFVVMMKKVR